MSAAPEIEMRGRCLCGAVTWVTAGPVLWAGHCHCDSCRRATGAPFTSFFGVPRDGLIWSGALSTHVSSEGAVQRQFCSACGTQMSYQFDGWPDETHLYAAALEDQSQFAPQAHYHYAEKLPWVALEDDLPRHPGSADATPPAS